MIYVFFAHGFEEIEAVTTLDLLRRAELEVRSVGVGSKTVTGAHGITIHCDILDKQAEAKGLEMIVLPGGMPGTLYLDKSPIVHTIIDFAVKKELWIGAICAAPSILGKKGILNGKSATCFPGFEEQLGSAKHCPDSVVQDGKIITAKGPGASVEFGLRLVACLLGQERAKVLEDSLQ